MGFVNLQTSSVPALPFEMAIKNIPRWGFVFFTNPAKRLCLRPPLLGEGLGVRL